MAYELFIERFGKLGWKETRSATVFENNSYGLPADEYGLLESYCDDENCDCRRVFLNIASRKNDEIIAVVTYGWETEAFYRKWFGGSDTGYSRTAAKEMTGLGLNSASPQSKFAPAALKLVRDLLQDQNYVARIKRHYKMFKETVGNQPVQIAIPDEISATPELPGIPMGEVTSEKAAPKTRKRHRSRRTDR
jgi:hypothetical protein